ncbi:MAG: hypothetical protein QXD31_02810 [Candidatus Caldarchaeum sp.]
MDVLGRSFFLLSGENPRLSAAELQQVLNILNNTSSVELINSRIASADVPQRLHGEIIERAALTKMAGLIIAAGSVERLKKDEIELAPGWENLVPEDVKVFGVDVVKISGASVNSLEVEKRFAEHILSCLPRLKVSLEKPDIVFMLLISPTTYVAGILGATKPKHFFQPRRAGRKPFRIPSALQPKLARCLVNLAVSSRDSRVLDPFAGSGAILVEAGLMGHEAVGLELKTWISNGMALNIRPFCPSVCHIVQGDAKRPPFTSAFDAIATDPPYGRSATLGGHALKGLLKKFFEAVSGAARGKARIAMIVPREEYENLLEAAVEFKPLQHHDVYVHKSLTRRVVVLGLE